MITLVYANRDLNQTQRISWSFAGARSATITFKLGTFSTTLATKTTTGVLDFTINRGWASGIPNAASGKATVTAQYFDASGNALTSDPDSGLNTTQKPNDTATFTVNVPDTDEYRPTITNVKVEDTSSIYAKTGNKYISDVSKVRVTLSVTYKFGATVKKNIFTIAGTSTSKTVNNFTFTPHVNANGNVVINIEVRDSRGLKATTSSTIYVYAYDPPTITSASVNRCDSNGTANPDGSYAHFKVTAGITKLTGMVPTYTLKYVSRTGATTNVNMTTYNTREYNPLTYSKQVGAVTKDVSYTFTFTVSDGYNTVTKNLPLDTGFSLINFNASGKGIGFGKVSEQDGIESAMRIESSFTGGMGFCQKNPVYPISVGLGVNQAGNRAGVYDRGNDHFVFSFTHDKPNEAVIHRDLVLNGGGTVTPAGTLADYVIETGTSNEWEYRKWASGTCEAWKTHTLTSQTFTERQLSGTTYGGSADVTGVKIPVAFKTVTSLNTTYNGAYYVFVGHGAIDTTAHTVTLRLARLFAAGSITMRIHMYMIGSWK